MKICDNCGAVNSDERFFCVDCNEKLDDAVSEKERDRIEEGIDSKIENLYNKKDPLYVSRFDKAMGVILILGVLATFVLFVIDIFTGFTSQGLWMALILFVLGIAEAFFPQISWAFEKMRLSFYVNGSDDAEPSDFYRYSRKASLVIFAAVGFALLALNIALF